MSSSPESKPNDADINPSPEPGIQWFRWSTVLGRQGEHSYSKIGSMDRVEYQEALTRAYRKDGVRASNPNRRPEQLLRATIDAMAQSVLLDWSGDVRIDYEKGFEPYSPAKAKRALEIDSFRKWVISIAENPENFTETK
jgi:hypothetical protein